MEPQGTLKAGIALSVVGAVFSLGASLLDAGQQPGLDDVLRPLANVATLFGLLALILAVYALAGLPAMPRNVALGAVLFVLGRLGSVALNAALPRNAFADPASAQFYGMLFATLGLISAVGTILLLYGVYQALRGRVAPHGSPAARPPAVASPPLATPAAPPAGAPRRSSFRPPQAPLPPPRSPPPHGRPPPPR